MCQNLKEVVVYEPVVNVSSTDNHTEGVQVSKDDTTSAATC